ncbi:type II toxin-antitoxin system ParD family antitoxin [Bradyrhizobium ontarionense]|uniref:Type II toxin-antitoxin system ParD family antitoxin n=1 Tax=Bradyrhizobium ontarionense TaxID=2898149 RepID=A0ABY3R3M6_9BRAD|nr:type II toxin-antitoxin system ParD family antitoxin [Bradyrhizobium sp. A19]UFZ01898.1 type II toxin-antitoxin system ParD family antitoxin [Bradyrhizobium sp. A19]
MRIDELQGRDPQPGRQDMTGTAMLNLVGNERLGAMGSKAFQIELSAKEQSLLQRQLEKGHYDNVNDVFADALRALDERGAVYDDFLRSKVKASLANKKPSIPAETVFERLEARHARRVKASKRGA